ncbi:hypothetical protein JTB14_036836 [Gonioctena quinquepunctata]|nr:hypothetical protein JTB14_036836 [Gonioctena quinquepunctata]
MSDIVTLYLSFLAFGIVYSQNTTLICYNCDPLKNSIEECQSPKENDAPVKVCGGANNVEKNVTYICLSAYLIQGNITGVVRDCYAANPEVADVCDLFKEEVQGKNVTVKSCHPCNTTRCNTIRLFADGTSGTGTSYNFITVIFSTLFLAMITLAL